MAHQQQWEIRVEKKLVSCKDGIPAEWMLPDSSFEVLSLPLEVKRNNLIELDICRRSGIFTNRELEITELYTALDLLKKLAVGDFTALEVTQAFCKRAAVAQQLTRCLTETFFSEAIEHARDLDALREEGRLAGPLHGLPISIKDGYQVVGHQATLGFVTNLDYYSSVNSTMVDVLLDLGAVLYTKTNIPQSLMTIDSDNNIFGRILNPLNTMLTAGGSSGGEGALIAFRGSLLGVGTDIAGSVRLPALCCGLYGFKPSAGRLPYARQQGCSNPAFRNILPSAGPIAHDLASLATFMKAVVGAGPSKYDSAALDLPWRTIQRPTGALRLGVLAEDPLFPLHPPMKAALAEVMRILRAANHEVVSLTADEGQVANTVRTAWELFLLDDTSDQLVVASGEPAIPSRQTVARQLDTLGWDKYSGAGAKLEAMARLVMRRAEITDAWRGTWAKYGLDAILAPVAQSTAVEHDAFGIPPYTAFVNLLDYPACAIPFGRAGPPQGDLFTIGPGQVAPEYKPAIVEGMPCSFQVLTTRLRDEECLAISGVIDIIIGREGSDWQA